MRLAQRFRPTAALLAGLALPLAVVALPPALAAQTAPRAGVVYEHFLSRARLSPAVVGAPVRVEGMGARLLFPLGAVTGGVAPGLGRRVAVGGFATYAPADDPGFTTWHYGAVADVRLLDRPVLGRLEPLVSLGAGAFRMQRDDRVGQPPLGVACVNPKDLPLRAADACLPPPSDPLRLRKTDFALSPAAGLRVALFPNVGLRADVRDVIVYAAGAPKHNFEFATGFSLAR